MLIMNLNKIQKSSQVKIIAGKDKGTIANVLKVRNTPFAIKVKLENINLKTRYLLDKKTRKKSMYKAESWIDISNVKLI